MKIKLKSQKVNAANFKVQGSALDVRNQLVEDSKMKLAKQQHGPRPHCGCC
jgi:hypothetical protein